jgi:hypothetical protein
VDSDDAAQAVSNEVDRISGRALDEASERRSVLVEIVADGAIAEEPRSKARSVQPAP